MCLEPRRVTENRETLKGCIYLGRRIRSQRSASRLRFFAWVHVWLAASRFGGTGVRCTVGDVTIAVGAANVDLSLDVVDGH